MPIGVNYCEVPLLIAKYSTLLPVSTTRDILPIWPITGWGTIRIYAECDVAVTLNVFQKERTGTATAGIFRRTDQVIIPAGPPALSKAFLVVGEYLRLQLVTGVAPPPTRFILLAFLYPGSFVTP